MADGYGKGRRAARQVEGARAAKEGKGPQDCPYTVDSVDFYERHDARYWLRGLTLGARTIARRAKVT